MRAKRKRGLLRAGRSREQAGLRDGSDEAGEMRREVRQDGEEKNPLKYILKIHIFAICHSNFGLTRHILQQRGLNASENPLCVLSKQLGGFPGKKNV